MSCLNHQLISLFSLAICLCFPRNINSQGISSPPATVLYLLAPVTVPSIDPQWSKKHTLQWEISLEGDLPLHHFQLGRQQLRFYCEGCLIEGQNIGMWAKQKWNTEDCKQAGYKPGTTFSLYKKEQLLITSIVTLTPAITVCKEEAVLPQTGAMLGNHILFGISYLFISQWRNSPMCFPKVTRSPTLGSQLSL